jgi:CBS domain-containing protein
MPSAYNQMSNLQEAMLSLKASDAMARDFRVVDADMTIRQFADNYLLEENRSPVYFAASEGRYRGLVSVDDIRTIERSQWETLTLQHIAKPLLAIPFLREQDPLTDAIDQLESLQIPRITVLSPADAVSGIIDRGEIVRAIADRLGLRISPAIIQRIKEDGQYPPGLQLASIARAAGEEAKA